jgi:hypothetical protein
MQGWTRIDAVLTPEVVAEVAEDRRGYFEGLAALKAGDLAGATRRFKEACKACEAPFDALALVALGECERVSGRHGVALKTWRKVAQDEAQPVVARLTAWTSIAAVEAERANTRGAEEAERHRQTLENLLGETSR